MFQQKHVVCQEKLSYLFAVTLKKNKREQKTSRSDNNAAAYANLALAWITVLLFLLLVCALPGLVRAAYTSCFLGSEQLKKTQRFWEPY